MEKATRAYEMKGNEALAKVATLTEVSVDAEKWQIVFLDENTGDKWLMDYPDSAGHGGGSPRLQKL